MPRVRIVHWKAAEAAPLIEACRECGFEVEYNGVDFPALMKLVRERPPDALVIDLTCRPAMSRDAGIAFRRLKNTRHVPLVFVDGEPAKVTAVREKLPDATYATRKQLCQRVRRACAKGVADPLVPPGMMESYRDRPAVRKLGIAPGSSVGLIDPPRDYAAVLGTLPDGVDLVEDPDSVHPVTLWFVRDPRACQAGMRRLEAIAGRTKLWILWPKASRNGLTQFLIREAANAAGLVDYKVCAVSGKWSGMALARRKS